MEFQIANCRMAPLIKPYIKYIHIAITDDVKFKIKLKANKKRLDELFLYFHDMETYIDGFKMFSEEQAKEILDFVYIYWNEIEMIVVNCDMGISRSAGVILALEEIINGQNLKRKKEYKHYNKFVFKTMMNVYNKNKLLYDFKKEN